MSRPAPSPFVARYVKETFARIDRMLAHLQLAAAHEVAPLEPLVEAIAGNATARVLGAAVHGIRRAFGAATAAQFQQLADAAQRAVRADTRPTVVIQVPSWHDAVGEMRGRLRARMQVVAADLLAVFAAAEGVLCDYDPRVRARVFGELADDMLLSRLYIDHVLASWHSHIAGGWSGCEHRVGHFAREAESARERFDRLGRDAT
ncbi:MAG: hypothetical protein SFX73_09305 [Kofleriaceae bacterium]|nr:hypothetical protein [Kofleriaceae bacterium]